MNGNSGYCIAMYGGGGGGMYGMSKVDNIMLKFRPIAPKPVSSGGSATSKSDGYVNCARSKRKYVRVNKVKRKKNSFKRSGSEKVTVKSSPSPSSKASPAYAQSSQVTLSLLPETPDRKENESGICFFDLESPVQTTKCLYEKNCEKTDRQVGKEKMRANFTSNAYNNNNEVFLSFNNQESISKRCVREAQPPPQRRLQVVSNVTVECVTDTLDLEGLGCTDEERVKNMENDTCPGFISDGQDRVLWTNKAYKQMVGVGHVDGEDVTVVLVRKDKWTPLTVTCPAFTCKVKVTSAVNGDRQTPCSSTLTLPCDVWRMERGYCAWRLDVKAALSLGR